jgi:co-chaperonin GroES (HSP10)
LLDEVKTHTDSGIKLVYPKNEVTETGIVTSIGKLVELDLLGYRVIFRKQPINRFNVGENRYAVIPDHNILAIIDDLPIQLNG